MPVEEKYQQKKENNGPHDLAHLQNVEGESILSDENFTLALHL